jgi:hypothetical protein
MRGTGIHQPVKSIMKHGDYKEKFAIFVIFLPDEPGKGQWNK